MTDPIPQTVTTIVGLEIHVQLQTESKLFCSCAIEFGAEPNSLTCPICTGMPGSLPVVNSRALELAIRAGVGLGCEIATHTNWDRKNYFYPDLPKGYQISQLENPVCGAGTLSFWNSNTKQTSAVRIQRAHLEEDAGKSIHDENNGTAPSCIDLNRAGTPLLEIVTEPDLRNGAEAKDFLTELKLILTYLNVSDCNMQQGNLRVDANVNLHIQNGDDLFATPIVEIKNLNSFRAVQRSVDFESNRQLEKFNKDQLTLTDAPKETRGWDDSGQKTHLQRTKELSADYRYFPDPDLVGIEIQKNQILAIQGTIGKLPAELRSSLIEENKISKYQADVIVAQGQPLVDFFFESASEYSNHSRLANWITQDVLRFLKTNQKSIHELPISVESFTEFLSQTDQMGIDQTTAQTIFEKMLTDSLGFDETVSELGIKTIDDQEMNSICDRLISENEVAAQQIRDGNTKAVGAIIGKAKQSNPNINPGKLRTMLLERLSNDTQ